MQNHDANAYTLASGEITMAMESGPRPVRWGDFQAGWQHGLDYPNGRTSTAVRVAESYSDPAAFLDGRNRAVVAWHENERERVAEGIEEEAERSHPCPPFILHDTGAE